MLLPTHQCQRHCCHRDRCHHRHHLAQHSQQTAQLPPLKILMELKAEIRLELELELELAQVLVMVMVMVMEVQPEVRRNLVSPAAASDLQSRRHARLLPAVVR